MNDYVAFGSTDAATPVAEYDAVLEAAGIGTSPIDGGASAECTAGDPSCDAPDSTDDYTLDTPPPAWAE
jgi:hypothetical protein